MIIFLKPVFATKFEDLNHTKYSAKSSLPEVRLNSHESELCHYLIFILVSRKYALLGATLNNCIKISL